MVSPNHSLTQTTLKPGVCIWIQDWDPFMDLKTEVFIWSIHLHSPGIDSLVMSSFPLVLGLLVVAWQHLIVVPRGIPSAIPQGNFGFLVSPYISFPMWPLLSHCCYLKCHNACIPNLLYHYT